MSVDGVLNGMIKLVMPAALVAAGTLAVIAVLDHMTLDRQAAERRALLESSATLGASALAPGSVLPCLDGSAGETVETACEKSIFASPQNAAAAVAYTAARLGLLAKAQGEPSLVEAFAPLRRAIELDRYGLAAHVLATRDACTADQCAAFDMVSDTAALKANLKAQVFDQYVSRYAQAWSKEPAKEPAVAEKAEPAPAEVPVAAAPAAPAGPNLSKFDFPSSASIPAVSIMNAEPALPKGAAEAQAQGASPAQPGPGEPVPVPAKRPPAPAAPAR